ncbi:MAG: pentapeptide repeat-containing protein, partial [Candidatus Competibacter sp.]
MPPTPQELRQRRLALSATPTKAAPDAKALLDAANSASQTVAALHIAFMAVCAYVLVIVFGTTDLDLLMGGNNVKLPVIDVMVPIVGFYAFAPYLVVLMHLNLLLQLQLLSRKLFAFDAATPAEEGVGGLRDRLHIFPYTYYLVGRPGAVVGGLLGLVVSVTLIVLPLATLLAMQLKFLAYQAESITWAQRVAVFLDVGFLVALWPVILHPRDDWKAWWRETLAAHLPRKRAWLAVIVLVASVGLILFAATPDLFTVGLILGAIAPLLLTVLDVRFPRGGRGRTILLIEVLWFLGAELGISVLYTANYPLFIRTQIPVVLFLSMLPLAFFWHPAAPHGGLALLSALVLAPLLALGLMMDGEVWEMVAVKTQKPLLAWRMPARQNRPPERQDRTLAEQFEQNGCMSIGQTMLSCVILAEQRRLDLNTQALFAKPPNPELRAALQAGKGLEYYDKLELISLTDRSLRRAKMVAAVLVGADLHGAQLQGADLGGAQLQRADLGRAQLQGANLWGAGLQGANLWRTRLQGANLEGAELQGANLWGASLQGAYLHKAELQCAGLEGARLEGADLEGARLEGADL